MQPRKDRAEAGVVVETVPRNVDLGIDRIRLLTNNPKKVVGLKAFGLEITERLPVEVPPNENNMRYLATKRDKLGHILNGLAVNAPDAGTGEED